MLSLWRALIVHSSRLVFLLYRWVLKEMSSTNYKRKRLTKIRIQNVALLAKGDVFLSQIPKDQLNKKPRNHIYKILSSSSLSTYDWVHKVQGQKVYNYYLHNYISFCCPSNIYILLNYLSNPYRVEFDMCMLFKA